MTMRIAATAVIATAIPMSVPDQEQEAAKPPTFKVLHALPAETATSPMQA